MNQLCTISNDYRIPAEVRKDCFLWAKKQISSGKISLKAVDNRGCVHLCRLVASQEPESELFRQCVEESINSAKLHPYTVMSLLETIDRLESRELAREYLGMISDRLANLLHQLEVGDITIIVDMYQRNDQMNEYLMNMISKTVMEKSKDENN